jgi:hypothetical protein
VRCALSWSLDDFEVCEHATYIVTATQEAGPMPTGSHSLSGTGEEETKPGPAAQTSNACPLRFGSGRRGRRIVPCRVHLQLPFGPVMTREVLPSPTQSSFAATRSLSPKETPRETQNGRRPIPTATCPSVHKLRCVLSGSSCCNATTRPCFSSMQNILYHLQRTFDLHRTCSFTQ